MAGNDFWLYRNPVLQVRTLCGNKFVARSVKTVTADVIFFVKTRGDGIHISMIRMVWWNAVSKTATCLVWEATCPRLDSQQWAGLCSGANSASFIILCFTSSSIKTLSCNIFHPGYAVTDGLDLVRIPERPIFRLSAGSECLQCRRYGGVREVPLCTFLFHR